MMDRNSQASEVGHAGDQTAISRDLQWYYENVYYGRKETLGPAPRHFRRLAARLPILPGQNVLDVACGRGEWLLSVQDAGAVPAGIDLSARAMTACKKAMPSGAFCTGVAERLPFDSERFDVVSCLGALEHFLSPESALEEMVRVGRDSAVFLFLVPNSDFLTRRVGLYRGTDQADVREQVRSLLEWRELFESAGLRIAKRWRDVHTVSWSWVKSGAWYRIPLRAAQAIALVLWPLSWQYQVYHLCEKQTRQGR